MRLFTINIVVNVINGNLGKAEDAQKNFVKCLTIVRKWRHNETSKNANIL